MLRVLNSEYKKIIKSKQYWFVFGFLIIAWLFTLLKNIRPLGDFNDITLGMCELFIVGNMSGNILLQISAPVLAVFVCLRSTLFAVTGKDEFRRLYLEGRIFKDIFANILASVSVFFSAFAFIFLIGIIFFPVSTGSTGAQIGLFKNLLPNYPVLYIVSYILHTSVCSGVYCLLGIVLKIAMPQNTGLCVIIPLVFHGCASRLGWALPLLAKPLHYILPIYTFDIATLDIDILKRLAELVFIFLVSIAILFIQIRRIQKANTVSLQN